MRNYKSVKIYMRVCRKCGTLYRSTAKWSRICRDCNVGKGIQPQYLESNK